MQNNASSFYTYDPIKMNSKNKKIFKVQLDINQYKKVHRVKNYIS